MNEIVKLKLCNYKDKQSIVLFSKYIFGLLVYSDTCRHAGSR